MLENECKFTSQDYHQNTLRDLTRYYFCQYLCFFIINPHGSKILARGLKLKKMQIF